MIEGNEPVLSHAPGSPERLLVDAEIATQSQTPLELPLVIGGERVLTLRGQEFAAPHRLRDRRADLRRGGGVAPERTAGADRQRRAALRRRIVHGLAPIPDDATSYERMVVIFNGDDDEALARARVAWSATKARGFEATYWQADENGRWRRRE